MILVSTFSGGMARRLEIARGMLHTPAVLFLNEPTIGLDPQTRALVWEDVLRLRRDEQARLTAGHAHGQAPGNQEQPMVRQGRPAAETAGSVTGPAARAGLGMVVV